MIQENIHRISIRISIEFSILYVLTYCRGYSFCNPQLSTTPSDERHKSTRTARFEARLQRGVWEADPR